MHVSMCTCIMPRFDGVYPPRPLSILLDSPLFFFFFLFVFHVISGGHRAKIYCPDVRYVTGKCFWIIILCGFFFTFFFFLIDIFITLRALQRCGGNNETILICESQNNSAYIHIHTAVVLETR